MARETIQSLKAQIAERDRTINQQTEMIMELQRKLRRSEEEIRADLKADYEKILTEWKQKYDAVKSLYEKEKERAEKQSGEYRKMITALSDELEKLKAAGSCVSEIRSGVDPEGADVKTGSYNLLYDHSDRRGRPALSEYAIERIRILRDQGRTIREIASDLGLSYGSVQRIVSATKVDNEVK